MGGAEHSGEDPGQRGDILSKAGYADVAKAYILYRKQREKVRNLGSTLLDYKALVDNYLQINDWRVQGELHRHLLRGRTDPLQLRRHHRQLLAQ